MKLKKDLAWTVGESTNELRSGVNSLLNPSPKGRNKRRGELGEGRCLDTRRPRREH